MSLLWNLARLHQKFPREILLGFRVLVSRHEWHEKDTSYSNRRELEATLNNERVSEWESERFWLTSKLSDSRCDSCLLANHWATEEKKSERAQLRWTLNAFVNRLTERQRRVISLTVAPECSLRAHIKPSVLFPRHQTRDLDCQLYTPDVEDYRVWGSPSAWTFCLTLS